jgi:hypothetical protein
MVLVPELPHLLLPCLHGGLLGPFGFANATYCPSDQIGGFVPYLKFVNQLFATLASLDINVIQAQFRHSQFDLVTKPFDATGVHQPSPGSLGLATMWI